MASEIARSGEYYYFSGSLNGMPVRFRLNDQTSGVTIPLSLAKQANVVTGKLPPGITSNSVWMAPIQTIMFGAHPMRAVMAKISVGSESDEIDVGPDSLAGFRVIQSSGRRILVPTSAARVAYQAQGASAPPPPQ